MGLAACLTTISAAYLFAQATNTQETNELKPAQKVFDLDGDGKLNETERIKMIQTAVKKLALTQTNLVHLTLN